ncbi:unnamed protein product [Agarophyton chilense]|eukprot:gb/GEZJ01000659.1/.p4 GENE.gb/GEZJ01000659.1/~~gb/GEZJ01000659.1/.p4  ORF type:complete len:743 (+),score=119.62 gb/GEZJ01000659.1/:17457-19685(+)
MALVAANHARPPPARTEAVSVVINARPLLPFEVADNAACALFHRTSPPCVSLRRPPAADVHFPQFDAAYFATNNCKPDALYLQHVRPKLDALFSGVNVTVFAYGQTSAGKSFTMSHLTDCVARDVFQLKRAAERARRTVVVRVGFVEIYKERIRDLVDANSRPAVPVQVRERRVKAAKHVFLDGARERCVQDENALVSIIRDGNVVRRTAATGMNASSSRSHSVITITVQQESEGNECLFSKLHLVDLAGSERVKRTAAQGTRFEEGVQINKGLFALAKVISALADKVGHVPYRDSNLTRLLQDSLGGNAKTLLIACVSPADSSREETLGTLRYAARAKRIQNKPVVNTEPDSVEISDLRAALARARSQIASLVAENERLRGRGKRIASPRSPLPSTAGVLHHAQAGCGVSPKRVEATGGRDEGLVNGLRERITKLENVLEAAGIVVEPAARSPLRKIRHFALREDDSRAPKRRPRVLRDSRSKACSFDAHGSEKRQITIGRTQSEKTLPAARRNFGNRPFPIAVEQDVVESNGYVDELENKVVNVLSAHRMDEMKRTFAERLQQAEEDKTAIDSARLKLVKRLSSTQKKHEREIEEQKSAHQAQMADIRSRLADVKRLEAEIVRMSKMRDGSDAARKKLIAKVESAEKSRDEAISRLTDVVGRSEIIKRNLVKENKELSKRERMIKVELNRRKICTERRQAVINRLRLENETLRIQLRDIGRQQVRRANSGITSTSTRTEC